MAVRYFKTKDGKILVSKRDGSSKTLAKRYTEVDKNGKAKAKKKVAKKKKSNLMIYYKPKDLSMVLKITSKLLIVVSIVIW